MAYIPNDVIQQVKESVNIVDVINQYVPLTKRGTNYMGSCPFHEDRNPSFSVSESKQIYKCFSCGRGGNVFGFMQEIEGISFPESVGKVADYGGVPLASQYLHQGQNHLSAEEKELYRLHQVVSDFYHYYLMHTVQGEETLKYLADRNFNDSTLEEFNIGLAPLESELLLQYLLKEDFSESLLLASGIFYQSEGGQWVDRFNDRLIIPLRNTQGKVLGFSGRSLPYARSAQSPAKYLNSPETPIFHKSDLLFNLDQARQPARQKGQILVTEGYMDVMALTQAGYPQVVATMGTSLTQGHLDQLSKLAQEVVFVFDGDTAGQKATERAFELSTHNDQARYKAIVFPDGMDPDEWLQAHQSQDFQRLIQQAVPRFDFMRDRLRRTYNLKDQEQVSEYIEDVLKLIGPIQSPIEQQLRLQELVQEFGLDEALLQERLIAYTNQATSNYQVESAPEAEELPEVQRIQVDQPDVQSLRAYQSEKMFIAYLIFYPEAWDYIESLSEPVLFYHPMAQDVYLLLQEYYYEKGHHFPMTDLAQEVDSPQMTEYLSTIIWDHELLNFDSLVMEDCLRVIQEEFIQQEIDELRQELKEKQSLQAYQEMDELMMKIMHLTRQLKYQQKGDS